MRTCPSHKAETNGTLRQCIANGNAVTADGKVSGGWGKNKAVLYRYGGTLLGERKSGTIPEEVVAIGAGALVGNGSSTACSTATRLEDIPFYSDTFGYHAAP